MLLALSLPLPNPSLSLALWEHCGAGQLWRDSEMDPAQLLSGMPQQKGLCLGCRQGHADSSCPTGHHAGPGSHRILKMMPPKQAEKAMRG